MLALATATVVSVSLAATVLQSGAGPRPAAPDRVVLGAATAAAVEGCADVLLLGADGAGERPAASGGLGFGPTVSAVVEAYTALAAEGGRSVEARRVNLTAPRAVALVESRDTSTPARDAVERPRARSWRSGVNAGVREAEETLEQAALTCPDQQVVLVGYAQGAALMHRVLVRRPSDQPDPSRLVGAVLVSDPERLADSVVGRLVGSPAASRSSVGVLPPLLRTAPDVPADTETFQVWQVCNQGDLLCNPRRTSVREGLKASRSYRRPEGSGVLAEAADGLWRQTVLVPVPRPRVRVESVRSGQPVEVRLEVDVADEAAEGVVWQDGAQVPPGLTLDSTGLLAGTPTRVGTWNLTYRVRNTSPTTQSVTGVVVVTVRSGTESVSAGGQTSCEVRGDGSLACWGANGHGQLGDGSRERRTSPVRVGRATDWESVSTGGSTTCGIRTDQTLWCWGLNNYGQLGIGRGPARSRPSQVSDSAAWSSVSTSWFHTCGIRVNGTLWCWGLNNAGELGDGTTQVRGRPVRVGEARDWTSVTAGGFHTCATRADATAWCWGQNAFGQVGNKDPVIRTNPQPVGTARSWLQLTAGWAHTCGVTTSGEARCWGFNAHGQLGDGSRRARRAPERVSGDQIWTSLSTGDASTCGVDNTGTAYCWGSNRYGQLGATDAGDTLEPGLVTSGAAWSSLEVGWFHACGALASGASACWGNNEAGQVGNGTTADQPLPEEVQ